MRRLMLLVLALLTPAAASAAGSLVPGAIYDGDKFDKSFNEAAYNGFKRFESETGTPFKEKVVGNAEDSHLKGLRELIAEGANFVVTVGFGFRDAVDTVAREHPQVRFSVIDSVVELPNVSSVLFSEQEGSFLAGTMAALKSQSGKVGFIAGMDTPVIQRFECGFRQGAAHTRPDVTVVKAVIGDTAKAYDDIPRARELARAQIAQGADVLYPAAGRSGLGALEEAATAGKLGIGVDSNQNHLHPGAVLTSMLKRVDVAAYLALKSAKDGSWKPAIRVLGLKEGGVDIAMDEHNARLVNDEILAKVEQAKDDIMSGVIEVHNVIQDGACTVAP